ncbi:MAG: hypothetical protein ABF479_10030 [Gluconacetobacter sp.]
MSNPPDRGLAAEQAHKWTIVVWLSEMAAASACFMVHEEARKRWARHQASHGTDAPPLFIQVNDEGADLRGLMVDGTFDPDLRDWEYYFGGTVLTARGELVSFSTALDVTVMDDGTQSCDA